jgi:hypothetical protein
MRFASLMPLAAGALSPIAARTADETAAKTDIPDPASLIGQRLDIDRQYDIGTHAQRMTAGDWGYGFEVDDPGLERTASTKESGSGASLLATYVMYDKRCARPDHAVSFSVGSDDHFALKGSVGSRHSTAWIFYGDKDTFDRGSIKVTMDFSENDAALYFNLDPARMGRSAKLALCPSAAAPGTKASRCVIFSLAGFARAYDFVCDGK